MLARGVKTIALFMGAISPLSALAAPAVPADCTAEAIEQQWGMTRWTVKPTAPVMAVAGATPDTAGSLGTGARHSVQLRDRTDHVRFAVAPAKAGDSDRYAGLLAFTITKAGPYRVALGSAAWVDIVRNGRLVASIGHAHGEHCSMIRKMVDFQLVPGRYLLQLSGSADPQIDVMVAPLP